MPEVTSFTCPKCKMTSHNPKDAQQWYCGNCHQWATDMVAKRGWWDMSCFNALSQAQQERLINWGNLPLGYLPHGGTCLKGAEVGIECEGDLAPGPRFYCRDCAIEYLDATRRANI